MSATTNNKSMEPNAKKVFRTLNIHKIWLPVVLGMGVAIYLFASDDNFSLAHLRLIGKADWRYMLLIFLAVIVRDVGYIYRIRVLTKSDLSWLSSFYILLGCYPFCSRRKSGGYFLATEGRN
jgi:glycosyltransferase 2 family protein